MNYTWIADGIVLYHYQGHASKFERFRSLADDLGIMLYDEEIKYGIQNVFYNNEFLLKNAKDETEKKLGALRYIAKNSLTIIRQYGGGSYQREVKQLSIWLPTIIRTLKKEEGYDIYEHKRDKYIWPLIISGLIAGTIISFIICSF